MDKGKSVFILENYSEPVIYSTGESSSRIYPFNDYQTYQFHSLKGSCSLGSEFHEEEEETDNKIQVVSYNDLKVLLDSQLFPPLHTSFSSGGHNTSDKTQRSSSNNKKKARDPSNERHIKPDSHTSTNLKPHQKKKALSNQDYNLIENSINNAESYLKGKKPRVKQRQSIKIEKLMDTVRMIVINKDKRMVKYLTLHERPGTILILSAVATVVLKEEFSWKDSFYRLKSSPWLDEFFQSKWDTKGEALSLRRMKHFLNLVMEPEFDVWTKGEESNVDEPSLLFWLRTWCILCAFWMCLQSSKRLLLKEEYKRLMGRVSLSECHRQILQHQIMTHQKFDLPNQKLEQLRTKGGLVIKFLPLKVSPKGNVFLVKDLHIIKKETLHIFFPHTIDIASIDFDESIGVAKTGEARITNPILLRQTPYVVKFFGCHIFPEAKTNAAQRRDILQKMQINALSTNLLLQDYDFETGECTFVAY